MAVARTPREVAEEVRKMVAGERDVFFDLFAADGVLAYPFAPPGWPSELRGREAIRDFFSGQSASRDVFVMDGVDALIRETDDPEVVVAEITHYGTSNVTGEQYRHLALGVIRVRDGEIVRYDDYMDPIAVARLTGHLKDLAAALTAS